MKGVLPALSGVVAGLLLGMLCGNCVFGVPIWSPKVLGRRRSCGKKSYRQKKMGYVMEGKNGVETALAREATIAFARAD